LFFAPPEEYRIEIGERRNLVEYEIAKYAKKYIQKKVDSPVELVS
jgi:hypothetical protein